jgi:hypothetical protein
MKRMWTIELTVISGGKVIQHEKVPFRSFVHNFNRLMEGCYLYANQVVTNTVGGSYTFVPSNNTGMRLNAAAVDDRYGIVVGTGTTIPTISDTKLQTQITHGTGSTQLSHAVCAIATLTTTTTGSIATTLTVSRVFTNNSGVDIIVTELGLYFYGDGTSAVCGARDKVLSGLLIPPAATLDVRYKFWVSL